MRHPIINRHSGVINLTLALSLPALFAIGLASPLSEPSAPAFLRLPVNRKSEVAAVEPSLQPFGHRILNGLGSASRKGRKGRKGRRQPDPQDDDLSPVQGGSVYTIEVEIGSPGQKVDVVLDTGSDELWINPDCNSSGDVELCQLFPRFDLNRSDTLVELGNETEIQYGSGVVKLAYYTDHVMIGDLDIKSQQFGIAKESSGVPMGIMGVGPSVFGDPAPYSLIVDSLASQDLINSRAFSLDLRDYNDSGSIIFGGIDTKKYTGSLEKVPMIKAEDAPDLVNRYWVYMNSIKISLDGSNEESVYSPGSSSSDDSGTAVFLDSGFTISVLPEAIVRQVAAAFPGTDSLSQPQLEGGELLYLVDCSVGESKGYISFGFGAKEVRVPFVDFLWHYPDGETCILGAEYFDTDGVYTLGAPFLRAAYVVYDQDNRVMHIAQASDCGEEIETIGSGSDAVPSKTGQCAFPSNSGSPGATDSLDPSEEPIGSLSLPNMPIPSRTTAPDDGSDGDSDESVASKAAETCIAALIVAVAVLSGAVFL